MMRTRIIARATGACLVLAACGLAPLLTGRVACLRSTVPDRARGEARSAPKSRAHVAATPAAALRAGCRWPAEFEPQGALLLGCHQLLREAPEAFVEIVGATQGKIELLAMVASASDYRLAHRLLEE